MTDDPYKRIEREPGSGVYQCGCRKTTMRLGTTTLHGIIECVFHAAVTENRRQKASRKHNANK